MIRNLFIIIAIFVGAVVIMLFGNIIVIGDKIGELTHVYVEYTFYAIILALFLLYVIRPIVKVYKAPEFPRLSVNEHWNTNQLLQFSKRLANNCDYISNKANRIEHKRELMRKINMHATKKEELKAILEKEIALRMDGNEALNVRGINDRIKEWGKTVFMVTAVSQNSKVDSLAVLVMNHKMITDIVVASGFRPTKPQMFKIYVKVLTTALISYCTSYVLTDVNGVAPFDIGDGDDIDVDDVAMDADVEIEGDENGMLAIINNLKKSRIAGILFDSAIEGCVNALLTLRIGYVTKAYIIEGQDALSGTKDKRKIKRKAMLDSFKAMPSVIINGGMILGETTKNILLSIFGKKDELETEATKK